MCVMSIILHIVVLWPLHVVTCNEKIAQYKFYCGETWIPFLIETMYLRLGSKDSRQTVFKWIEMLLGQSTNRATLLNQWKTEKEFASSIRLNPWRSIQRPKFVETYKIDSFYYVDSTKVPNLQKSPKPTTLPSKLNGCYQVLVQKDYIH